jgi:hypothetical protein
MIGPRREVPSVHRVPSQSRPPPHTDSLGDGFATGQGSTQLRHLNQEQLARRWNISPRTLERWRWLKQGPNYLKVGGRVLYRLDDIETYETVHLHTASRGHGTTAIDCRGGR